MHTYTGITKGKLNVAEIISQIMPNLTKVHLENTAINVKRNVNER
jgi:hypothetical protein